ncbi:MAG: hypothetical protein M1839_007100 [Geoglossum umbratile]|nr:MAG: hypothetical protein M1839_007100 [Geoglossum umbratile]
MWKSHESPASWEARNSHQHDQWKGGLRQYYNAYDPENQDYLWCPILKEYASSDERTAAHIVPHSIGYTNAGYLFGDRDRGAEFIWSMGNGLVMDNNLEKKFDKGDFILVPITVEHGKPSRWRFILMNEKLRTHGFASMAGGRKYGDLDGMELEFKNNNRPAHRFLYYHFVLTLLRYVRKDMGYTRPYLRKSMLKAIANVIGDCEPSGELFGDGVFDGKDNGSPQEEKLMAQEILVERAQRAEGEKFELPTNI